MQTVLLVAQFHEVFNHLIADRPTIPDQDTVDFRTNFIIEEMKELQKAVDDKDIVGIADALGDIQYVLDGLFLNVGLHNHKEAIIAAIHKSNMTKVCGDMDEVIQTQATIKAEHGWDTYHEQVDKYYIVKRSSDGKVMKSIFYRKPDFSFLTQGK